MKKSLSKITLVFLILTLFFLLFTKFAFSQLNSNVLKQDSFRFEQSIVNLKTTIEEGMNHLDNIDDNYLTKIITTMDKNNVNRNSSSSHR